MASEGQGRPSPEPRLRSTGGLRRAEVPLQASGKRISEFAHLLSSNSIFFFQSKSAIPQASFIILSSWGGNSLPSCRPEGFVWDQSHLLHQQGPVRPRRPSTASPQFSQNPDLNPKWLNVKSLFTCLSLPNFRGLVKTQDLVGYGEATCRSERKKSCRHRKPGPLPPASPPAGQSAGTSFSLERARLGHRVEGMWPIGAGARIWVSLVSGLEFGFTTLPGDPVGCCRAS